MDEGEDQDDIRTSDQWLNLDSFNARLLGFGWKLWYKFAVWKLREGWEEEYNQTYKTDCKITVAKASFIQAAPEFLQDSLMKLDLSEA